MLPASNRLRATPDFRTAVRTGVRVSRGTLVLHAVPSDSPPTRVGFVVSKAVGNAVVRNRVKRRLRHLAQSWVTASPFSVLAVVRALPGCAARPSDLACDFASAWVEMLGKVGGRP